MKGEAIRSLFDLTPGERFIAIAEGCFREIDAMPLIDRMGKFASFVPVLRSVADEIEVSSKARESMKSAFDRLRKVDPDLAARTLGALNMVVMLKQQQAQNPL